MRCCRRFCRHFTPTNDILTQKTVIITLVQREGLNCEKKEWSSVYCCFIFTSFLMSAGIQNQLNSCVQKSFIIYKYIFLKVLHQWIFVKVSAMMFIHFISSNLQLLLEMTLSGPRKWLMMVWWWEGSVGTEDVAYNLSFTLCYFFLSFINPLTIQRTRKWWLQTLKLLLM